LLVALTPSFRIGLSQIDGLNLFEPGRRHSLTKAANVPGREPMPGRVVRENLRAGAFELTAKS
jgi:hypothetical protein